LQVFGDGYNNPQPIFVNDVLIGRRNRMEKIFKLEWHDGDITVGDLNYELNKYNQFRSLSAKEIPDQQAEIDRLKGLMSETADFLEALAHFPIGVSKSQAKLLPRLREVLDGN
jgi:hypothetical protein